MSEEKKLDIPEDLEDDREEEIFDDSPPDNLADDSDYMWTVTRSDVPNEWGTLPVGTIWNTTKNK